MAMKSTSVTIGSSDKKLDSPGVMAEPLTDWKKEPTVADLKEDLLGATYAHTTQVNKIRHWNDLRNVTGSAAPKKVKGRSSIQPKLVRKQAEWRYSALSEPFNSSPDLFTAEAVTFEDEAAAKQNAQLLNWQFRTKMNKVKFIDEFVRTAVDEGTVVVRTGWKRITKKIMVSEPVFAYYEPSTEEELTPLEEALKLKIENPRGFYDLAPELQAAAEYMLETQKATIAQITGYEDVEQEQVLVNQPTVDIINFENVFIDPSAQGDILKAGFVIYSFETSKAELIKDGRYKNLDKVNWSGAEILAQPDHASSTPNDFNFKDDLRRRIVAYEYWGYYNVDDSDELKPILATWVGETMIRMEENPFPDEKPPFTVTVYLPIKRQITGEPDAELLEDNQKITGAVTRGMIDLMGRSANAQQGTAKGFLDVTNRRRYEAGLDYEFNPSAGDPRLSVFQHSYPEIPNSAMNMIQMQNYEAESLTGVKAFAGGLSGEAYGDVAAGIKGMLDASAKREMNILRRLAGGIVEIGHKIAAMNAVFLSEEEVIRVTNEDYVTIKREDLKGNFDFIVDISTPEIDASKAQDLSFMLQTMGPDMAPELSQVILAEIADLKRQRGLAEKIRNWKPTPNPLDEQLKQLEIQKLQMEIEKLKSEAAKNNADALVKKSAADLNNLDFVEQETGTKHARDLAKQSEQAQANQDLEVTKALLKSRKPEESKPEIEAAVGFNRIADVMKRQAA